MRKDAYVPDVIPKRDIEMLEKYGAGHGVGFGKRIAILVVDVTYAFVDDKYPSGCSKTGKPAVKAIKKLLDKARQIGVPILYSKGFLPSTDVERGRWINKVKPQSGAPPKGNEIAKDVAPKEGDAVILKAKPSAFFGTQLQSILTYLNIDTLIVTGMVTSGCIRATVVDAFSYNYRVVIPIECVADRAELSHEVNLFDMDMKYADIIPLSEVISYLEKLARMA